MNTLLVTVDALRADHVGYHGYNRPTTPTLDAFAAEHAYFTRAFANGTFTSAALPAILTGSLRKDSSEPMVLERNLQIREPNLASVLRDNGVHTAGINTNLLFYVWYERVDGFDEFNQFVPLDEEGDEGEGTEGFRKSLLKRVGKPVVEALGVKPKARRLYDRFRTADEIRSTTYYDATAVTDRVLDWLNAWNGGDFFLWVHYMDPHEPYGYLDSMSTAPIPSDSAGRYESPREIERVVKRAGQDPKTITASERELLVDLYDGYVRFFDNQLGRLFGALRDRGLYNGTQIVITSDHGEEFGEHGMYFHYNRPYDELIHVPLVVKSPAVDSGTHQEQVSHIDIAPTVLDGHDIDPTEFGGKALGRIEESRPVIALGSDRPNLNISSRPFAAIRYPSWKFIYDHGDSDELYHLSNDPEEQADVSAENSETADQLRSELLEQLRFEDDEEGRTTRDVLRKERESRQRQLKDLGYIE